VTSSLTSKPFNRTLSATMAPVWLITAASSGFGKGIALEALARGYTVIATARNSAKLEDLKNKGAITADLDVTHDLEKLKSIAADLHAKVGRFDVFINAAGYILEGAIEEARSAFCLPIKPTPDCH
jgi:NADP-dependent 3-hydroxy acid dehydrogenase YdfG